MAIVSGSSTAARDALKAQIYNEFLAKKRKVMGIEETPVEMVDAEPEKAKDPVVLHDGEMWIEDLCEMGWKLDEPVALRVHSPEDWPEEVRPFIPDRNPEYIYRQEFVEFCQLMKMGLKTMLVGKPGTGKDEMARQYCAITCTPYRRLTGMRNVTPDMIIGRRTMQDGNVLWEDGDAIMIARHGGMLVLSEPAAFPSDTFFAFQSMLETRGYLSVMDHPDPSDRMLFTNPETKLVLTSNVRGFGDSQDKYSATGVMDASTLNRLEAVLEIPYMTLTDESRWLSTHLSLPENTLLKMCKFGSMIREAWDLGKVEASWSQRNLLAWAKAANVTSNLMTAFRMTFWGRLNETEREVVGQFWQDVGFEGELK